MDIETMAYSDNGILTSNERESTSYRCSHVDGAQKHAE